MGSAPEIARVVNKQISHYTYTFPNGPPVSPTVTLSSILTSSQSAGAGLVRRSQPYRNDRIITVIRDLYFTGYPTSFAAKYEDHFPLHRGDDGRPCREVPIPMVALVATAVSLILLLFGCTELTQSISCMPLSVSGRRANSRHLSFLPMPTWMCTKAM